MSKLSVALPFSGPGWRSGRLRAVSGGGCQAFDLAVLGIAFFAVVVQPYFAQTAFAAGGGTLAQFLELRVSLRNVLVAVLCLATWRMVLVSVGLYAPSRSRSLADYLFRGVIGLNSCTAVVGLIEVVLRRAVNLWHGLEFFWLVSLAGMAAGRIVLVAYDRHLRPVFRRTRRLLIVGSGERARQVYEELRDNPDWNYSLVGFIDSEPQGGFVPPELLLGGTEDLEHILMYTVVDEVVIALPLKSQYETVGEAIATCQMLGVPSQYFTDYFGTTVTKRRSPTGDQSGRILLEVVTDDYRLALKRLLDIAVSLTGIVLFSPVLLITAAGVKLTSPGPVLFRQRRYGLNKRTFSMLKFRSMCVDAESRQAAVEHLNELTDPTFKIREDPRVTPIGAFLRKMSIDELPQLFNVLAGDMSLVGPRPLTQRDVEKFSEAWLMRRFSVKPGITCLWQIMGRSNTDFERWIDLDLEYIDNWSLSLDLIILLKTVPAVLVGRGAS